MRLLSFLLIMMMILDGYTVGLSERADHWPHVCRQSRTIMFQCVMSDKLPSPHETPGAVNIDAVSTGSLSPQLSVFGEEKKMLMEKEPFTLFTDTEASGANNCCLDLCLISLMICARFKRIVNPNFNYCMIYSFSCYSKPFSVEHNRNHRTISFLYSDSYCHHDYQALKGQNKTNQQTNKHHKTL